MVERPNNRPNNVDWVISDPDSNPKISDVIAAGTSFRLTQRSDYASYLAHNSVDALIDALQEQAEHQLVLGQTADLNASFNNEWWQNKPANLTAGPVDPDQGLSCPTRAVSLAGIFSQSCRWACEGRPRGPSRGWGRPGWPPPGLRSLG